MILRCFLSCVILLILPGGLQGQTTINPDISVVGDFRGLIHNDESRPSEIEKVTIADPGMELVASGYLNPYARADAVVGWHGGHNAEIEELYATILRGLPLGLNLRVGKYLLEFGRLNPVHEHAWSFIKRPLPHELFFGEEGLNDMAVRASVLLPTGGAYTELMAGVLKGNALHGHHHEEEEHEHEKVSLSRNSPRTLLSFAQEDEHEEESERIDPGFFGRLTTSLALADAAELALGASVVNAVYAESEHEHESELALQEHEHHTEQLRAWVTGVDAKYKYRPSRYTSLQIEAEGLLRSEELPEHDNLTSYGGYGYLDYRFRQKYNIGGIFEYVSRKELHEHEGEHEEETSDTWRAGLFVGFSPIEETSLVRLAGHWTEPEEEDGFFEVTLQFVFSLGPHQPHNF